ncbi:MAG: hypothetical protein Wins2KO_14790 [Winogradskyella sp.]
MENIATIICFIGVEIKCYNKIKSNSIEQSLLEKKKPDSLSLAVLLTKSINIKMR